ncbi:hypothetical protein H9L39_12423 [Fusarium oxysporum f. sp. albedinis]|nr:hypothetical protein H9L39_12423 [Fusarium oxysporum f. sp. albedinis]
MKKGSVIYWDFSQTSHSNQSIQKGAELYQDEIDTLPRAVLVRPFRMQVNSMALVMARSLYGWEDQS